ncbi:MAG: DUF1565 domain-containing protein [Bacteroidales bacterium]|nr:DUF1565 domain-containing protein [Bacteroidales bacterium]
MKTYIDYCPSAPVSINAELITVPSGPPYVVETEHNWIVDDSSIEIWENDDKSGTHLVEEAYDGSVSGSGKFQVDYLGASEGDAKYCNKIFFHADQGGLSFYVWYKTEGDVFGADDANSKALKDSDAVSGNIAEFDANGNPVDSSISSSDTSDAISKKHTQNTDTGTTSQTFQLQSDSSGAKLKNSSGVVEIRNSADSAYADIRPNNIYPFGSTTTPLFTTAVTTYYVNGSTGNDSNDGSSGSPFKTIAKAISKVPQIVNNGITINIADGTYTEGITLQGRLGNAFVQIVGNSSTPSNVVLTGQIALQCNTCYIILNGFKTTKTGGHGFYLVNNPGYIYILNCQCVDSDASYDGIHAASCPAINVYASTFSNRNNGIHARTNTSIVSTSNSGSGNTVGLACVGATIMKYSSQPGGTTGESTSYGGIIR